MSTRKHSGRQQTLKTRNQAGNMLVLILSVTLGLLLTILFFGLNYTRLLGGNAEQKKAIEAAALAAAADLGNIVINTPEMGYVSLSDQAPIGKTTQAGDQYYMPVRGINTIIGTCRLDAIIADKLPNSGPMKQLAANDFTAAKSVLNQLNTALSKACTSGAGGSQYTDRDGNNVDVSGDAIKAYKQNAYRMSGNATYVENSLKLTMGSLSTPSDTNIPIPQPTSVENLSQSFITNGNYKSFVNIPYDNVNYVFGGIGSTIRLVDVRNFVTNLASVEYQVPTIVKAECDELVKTNQTPEGNTFHASACAEPSSTFDPRPAPGAIAIEFPDGQVPEFTKPGDLLTKLNQGTTVKSAQGGDFPTSSSSTLNPTSDSWPPNLGGGSPTTGTAWGTTLYDWIRRGGTRANISSILAMSNSGFGTPPADQPWWAESTTAKSGLLNISSLYSNTKIPMGVSHTYKFDSNGNVQYKKQEVLPYPFEATSENQLYTETKGKANGAFISSTPLISFNSQKIQMPKGIRGVVGSQTGTIKAQVYFQPWYDMYVRDNSRVLGNQKGGKHGGEPMDDALVASSYGTERSKFSTRLGSDYGAGGAGAGSFCDSGGCGGPPCGGPPAGTPPLDGTGLGSPPLLSAESDFGDAPSNRPFGFPPPYVQFAEGPGGGAVRATYQKTGIVGSIRFRRQVQFDGNLADITGQNADGSNQYGNFSSLSDIGYIGARVKGNGVATYSVSDNSASAGYYPDVDVVDDFQDK